MVLCTDGFGTIEYMDYVHGLGTLLWMDYIIDFYTDWHDETMVWLYGHYDGCIAYIDVGMDWTFRAIPNLVWTHETLLAQG